MSRYWLLKAEPDSRVIKGEDVKFSVDDFEAVKTSPWEGVRNYEARNLMKEMKVGDKALFYHSNCKTPGIAAFAEVSKEAYPDYTAWDPNHPYYDAKTDKENPKWFMVELTFASRARHFVPLSLLKRVAGASASEPTEEIRYIGETGVKAIKSMDLVTRGRLSVQRVDESAWNTVKLLAEQGGWEESDLKSEKKSITKKGTKGADVKRAAAPSKARTRVGKKKDNEDAEPEAISEETEGDDPAEQEVKSQPKKKAPPAKKPTARKREATTGSDNADDNDGNEDYGTRRRSKRTRKI